MLILQILFLPGVEAPSLSALAIADILALVKYWYIWYTKDVTDSLSGTVVVTIMLGVRGQAMPRDRAMLNAWMNHNTVVKKAKKKKQKKLKKAKKKKIYNNNNNADKKKIFFWCYIS